MIVLEGIAVTGDPEFDLFRAAYPYRCVPGADMCGFYICRRVLILIGVFPELTMRVFKICGVFLPL
jgi:hypothetical protein